jgi:hypothetical protein
MIGRHTPVYTHDSRMIQPTTYCKPSSIHALLKIKNGAQKILHYIAKVTHSVRYQKCIFHRDWRGWRLIRYYFNEMFLFNVIRCGACHTRGPRFSFRLHKFLPYAVSDMFYRTNWTQYFNFGCSPILRTRYVVW